MEIVNIKNGNMHDQENRREPGVCAAGLVQKKHQLRDVLEKLQP